MATTPTIPPGALVRDLFTDKLVKCERTEGSSVWVRIGPFCSIRRKRSQVRPAVPLLGISGALALIHGVGVL